MGVGQDDRRPPLVRPLGRTVRRQRRAGRGAHGAHGARDLRARRRGRVPSPRDRRARRRCSTHPAPRSSPRRRRGARPRQPAAARASERHGRVAARRTRRSWSARAATGDASAAARRTTPQASLGPAGRRARPALPRGRRRGRRRRAGRRRRTRSPIAVLAAVAARDVIDRARCALGDRVVRRRSSAPGRGTSSPAVLPDGRAQGRGRRPRHEHRRRRRSRRRAPASSRSATARTPRRSPRSRTSAAQFARWGLIRADVRRRASAAAWSPTPPASPPPCTTAASPSCTCRPRCSGRSTPPSAARPASTCPRARTSSARSGSRRRCLCDTELLADAAAARVPQRAGRDGEVPLPRRGDDLDRACRSTSASPRCVAHQGRGRGRRRARSRPTSAPQLRPHAGHALETAGRYDLRHGEAVAIGLVFAAELAHRLGRIDAARVAEHRRVVGVATTCPATLPAGADPDELVDADGPRQEGDRRRHVRARRARRRRDRRRGVERGELAAAFEA